MEQAAERIQFYHRLFLGCLMAFLLCLVLCIVLFFLLKIPEVLGYLTGWRARKAIRKMEEGNGGMVTAGKRENPGRDGFKNKGEKSWNGEETVLLGAGQGRKSRLQVGNQGDRKKGTGRRTRSGGEKKTGTRA